MALTVVALSFMDLLWICFASLAIGVLELDLRQGGSFTWANEEKVQSHYICIIKFVTNVGVQERKVEFPESRLRDFAILSSRRTTASIQSSGPRTFLSVICKHMGLHASSSVAVETGNRGGVAALSAIEKGFGVTPPRNNNCPTHSILRQAPLRH